MASKFKSLCLHLVDPNGPHVFDAICNVYDTFTKSRTQKITSKKYYRGELESAHGKKEAAKLIRDGIFKEWGKDAKNNILYIKKTEEEVIERSRKQEQQLKRHSYLSDV